MSISMFIALRDSHSYNWNVERSQTKLLIDKPGSIVDSRRRNSKRSLFTKLYSGIAS